MAPASALPFLAAPASSPRQRMVSLALVALLHLLILLALLRMVSPVPPEKPQAPVATLTVVTVHDATPDTSHAAKARRSRAAQGEAATRPVQRPAHPSPSDLAAARMAAIWAKVIPMNRMQMASVDRAMTARSRDMQMADAGDAAGETDDTAGPGHGPNGETLYNARWYKEPTNAELDAYLPPGTHHDGWGIIACRTVDQYRVDDCIEIAQSPGSGMAGAVRQAAWQFRVMPPRIGGRRLVGEWVRIRIDYTFRQAAGPPAGPGR